MEIISYCALDKNVLCVAVRRMDGWCSYIMSVEGFSYRNEAKMVAKHGAKLSKKMAEAVFPDISEMMQAEGKAYVV